ncbi:MAG: DUF6130 family protein [Acidobacteriota bacterium]
MFGPGALAVSPRVGHIHVTVDDTPWHRADASGNPVIVQGLLPGSHKILIELADADHHVVDRSTVTFVVPASVRTASRPVIRHNVARNRYAPSTNQILPLFPRWPAAVRLPSM